LVVLVAMAFLANLRGIRNRFGTGAIIAAFLVIAGAFLIGYTGEHDPEIRGMLVLPRGNVTSAQPRSSRPKGFDDPGILVIVTSSLVGLALFYRCSDSASAPGPARSG